MNKEEFNRSFPRNVFNELYMLEEKRKNKLCIFILLFFFVLIEPILAFALPNVNILASFVLLVVAMLIVPTVIMYIIIMNKNFSVEIKKTILPKILLSFGDIRNCNDKKLDMEKDLISTGLFPRNINFVYDDKYQGTYKGVNFEILESLYPHKEIILGIELNKKTNNRTIIVPKRVLFQKNSDLLLFWLPLILFIVFMLFSVKVYSLIKILEYILFLGLYVTFFVVLYFVKNEQYNKEALNKIILEDVKLEKKYNVYSSNELEARYMITPAFMERILNLKTVFKGKDFRCAFYNGKLILVIETKKDAFEFGTLFKPISDYKSINTFYSELSSLLNIIDQFRLAYNIGL